MAPTRRPQPSQQQQLSQLAPPPPPPASSSSSPPSFPPASRLPPPPPTPSLSAPSSAAPPPFAKIGSPGAAAAAAPPLFSPPAPAPLGAATPPARSPHAPPSSHVTPPTSSPSPASSTSSSSRRSHTLGFPVFAVAFAPKKPRLVVGGGGGASKSGVKNSVLVYELDESSLDMSMIASHYLTSQDDSIQSIAVHPKEKTIVAGANSPDDDIARGSNLNCRFFTLTKDNRLLPQKAVSTLEGVNGQYQRVARYSPDGQLLATGGTDGKLHILQSSDCTEAVPHLELGGEAYDAHFDPLSTTIVAVSSKKCFVVNVKQGRTLWFTEKPIISGLPGDFRASRFGTGLTQGSIYLVVNAHSRKKAFVCKWNTSTWKMERFRAVAEKPVTAFTISDDGSLLGVGASDASVSILDAKSLTLLQRFPNAHGFPITSLSFSPSSRVLVSGSADGTCHVAKVAPKGRGMSLFSLFLLALLLVLLLVSVALYLIGLPSDDGEL